MSRFSKTYICKKCGESEAAFGIAQTFDAIDYGLQDLGHWPESATSRYMISTEFVDWVNAHTKKCDGVIAPEVFELRR